ncbi:GASA/GAST/Snakin [Medicago truncatula]|uniref:GASA/GAST/Snakin n=1 Tax=Medicago truncatula TaxID=3880 RepID=A0A072UFN3_MEDTR|nr:GASA/GAST/Snakin [Medicago truncatula]
MDVQNFVLKIVNQGVHIVVLQHHTRNHACFSAKNVVLHVFVFLLVCMVTSKFVLATTAGRHRKENQNALKNLISSYKSIIKQCCPYLFFKNANCFHTYSV